MQLGAGHILPARFDLLHELTVFPVNLLPFGFAELGPGFLVIANQQHVLHTCASVGKSNGGCPDRHLGKKVFTIYWSVSSRPVAAAPPPPRRHARRGPRVVAAANSRSEACCDYYSIS